MQGLDMMRVPQYHACAYRRFLPHERHICRVFSQDVLILMLGGTLRFDEAGRSYALRKGEWYIQRRGLMQAGHEESDEPFYFYIHFTGEYACRDTGVLPLQGTFAPERAQEALRALAALAQNPAATQVERAAAFLRVLEGLYACHAARNRSLSAAEDILQYLSGRFRESVSIHETARRFGYSYDHFIRVFRQAYHITPGQYLIMRRVNHGKTLLTESALSVQQIAAECGYPNADDFYRVFRKHAGVSPSEYRRQACEGMSPAAE